MFQLPGNMPGCVLLFFFLNFFILLWKVQMAGYLFTLPDLRGCNIGLRTFSFAVSEAESEQQRCCSASQGNLPNTI